MTRRPALAAAALTALLALTACGSGDQAEPTTPSETTDPSPPGEPGATGPQETADVSQLSGVELYTNPRLPVPMAIEEAQEAGREEDLAVLERLNQPTATWFYGQDDPAPIAERITEEAQAAGTTPVLVVYDVPGRDCDSYSKGGAADAEEYKAYVGAIGSGLGDRPAIVVLEPDAVPQTLVDCPTVPDPAARHQLLSESVDILRKQPGARIYLDAGNSSWIQEVDELAAALDASGLQNADGFSLNVSNFETTEASAEYGQRLSEATGGKRFVIDTSRNGAGPPPEDGSGEEWCNPEGREVGEAPTTDPGIEGVDALLWVKQPGDSDGACRGAPEAGVFSLEFARDLAG